ncbi:uncharacterized protein PITG_01357 [Phytophthora infestans T30-4]|uniref:DUF6604 domain-containing protein n=1 Tax=Phytophthora infestans (strain T30-4) TaxID=403677 RepID=D0MVB5_PHYIT|nr:uncharacterized protein PITG_01357 [Phytophthora infestans T30-4]EEY61111.1 conserved hypothetical protein [Phytophthora infestans T30-4]|eukprot:XP_002908028.1 conserved hypothetical protein [Phytophthora infestans T30-4]
MMMTSQSFPVGKYARYKRATAFFLNWLARAGRRERGGNNLQLETFNDVVEEILANPSTLTTELLQECSKALAACQYAIELREHVASFFSEHDEGQASHQHFVELLRNWHRALKSVVMGRSKTIVQLEISERENYYEVLEVDDEYLPDEDSFSTAKQLPKATKVDRNPVLQEAFADGMKVEVVCFFSELDELMQGVCKAYGEVKREERTLVEATVVAKLAMDSASALTAQLQLKYPALRTSEDMYNVVRNIDPVKFRHRMATIHTKYLTDLQDSLLNGDGAVPYVPGMFLMDFLGVGTTLASFLTALPIDTTKSLEVPTGCFGEVYSEDRTPHYVLLPDPSKMNVFLLQQLPLLHKTIMEKKVTTGSGHDSSAPMESFMVLMEKYFTCREVTVPVVFTCICWIKSVAALQGDVGLGRNVSLTFRHSTELMRNIKETVAKGTVRKAHNKSNNLLQLCADEIKRSTGRRYLSRANPLLAGLTMLDHHFKYLHMASEILLVTSRFRSFGHVYNALVKEGYLEQISSLDDLLEVYSEMIFTPSRDAATRGLNRSSWASILDDAANICSKELSQTRVLSRDLLKLNDELANVYVELCAELKEGDWYGQTITDTGADLIEQQKMEDGVIMILLQLLDGLQSDHGGPDFGGPVDMCKKAAAVIRKTFSTSSTVRSEKIFTILSRPDFISQEFDLKSDKSRVENDNCEQIFFKLMKLLQGSNGPLSKSDRSFIKAEIKKNSGLLEEVKETLKQKEDEKWQDEKVAVRLGRDLAPLGPFMAIMDTFFKTREVTLPVAFACICWMKFVAALQGRRGLGRNVSLTFQHSKDLQKRIEEAVEHRKALLAYNKANSLLERCTGEIKHFVPLYHIARANPLFAGLTALNHQFQYLHIANEVLFATSKLRAFGHLYNALVQEGHLERNPFFDDVYDVYGQEVFAPSRAAAIHGAYYRTYLISSNLRVNLIEAVYRGEELPAPSEAYKKKKAFHLSDVSEIFRLSRLNDKSILKGGSWKDMLEDVANLCSRELFETRVLSRDLLKLNEDLTDLFPELVRVLGQHNCFSSIMDNSVAGESRQQRLSRALEESIYFTYLAQPDFVTQEYGGPDPDTRRDDSEQVFEDLMKLLRESDGPLSASDLSYLKAELKKDPNLLGLISSDPDPHDATKYRELSGHEDIVRVIPDNMMDMNIPTFHTKETLAHLAVKNGHKDLFNILRAFGLQIGADLRIKDGKGQSVSDVAIDREFDGFDINENMELESVTVLRDKLRKLAVSIITRLGNPFGDKTDDDYNARKLVQDMEDDVASYSQPSNPNSTRFHVRVVICSEAAYCLHLM